MSARRARTIRDCGRQGLAPAAVSPASAAAAASPAAAAPAATPTAATATTATPTTSNDNQGQLLGAARVFLIEEMECGKTNVSHFLFAKNEALIG